MLMTVYDVADYLGVPRGSARVPKWLQENDVGPVEDFGPGKGGGKRWRSEDIEAVHTQKAIKGQEERRVSREQRRESLFKLPWNEAKKLLEGKKK